MAPTSQEAIASYVTDMLALEEHIEKAIDAQIKDFADRPDAGDMASDLRQISMTCAQHQMALKALAERRQDGGQGVAGVVKKAASSVLGLGAAAVDLIRTEKVPKNLRDDYTAVSLASIGYVMLYTTAMALDDQEAADLAHEHLQHHAQSTMTLHSIVPIAVVRFLREEGHAPREDVLPEIEQRIQQVWEGGENAKSATRRA